MKRRTWQDQPDEYQHFKPGDRFTALLLGYQRTYRVKRVELRIVMYSETDIVVEPVIVTKSNLVWTTHVCGALLDFYGRCSIDYVPSPATKTWRSMQPSFARGEKTVAKYAPGEK